MNQSLRIIRQGIRANDAKVELEILHRRIVPVVFVAPLKNHSAIQPTRIRAVGQDGFWIEDVLRRVHVLPGNEAEIAGQGLVAPPKDPVQPRGDVGHRVVPAEKGNFDAMRVVPVLVRAEGIRPAIILVSDGKNIAPFRRFVWRRAITAEGRRTTDHQARQRMNQAVGEQL